MRMLTLLVSSYPRPPLPRHVQHWPKQDDHSSCVSVYTLYTSHLTPHTSHLTHHTSHLIHHTSLLMQLHAQLRAAAAFKNTRRRVHRPLHLCCCCCCCCCCYHFAAAAAYAPFWSLSPFPSPSPSRSEWQFHNPDNIYRIQPCVRLTHSAHSSLVDLHTHAARTWCGSSVLQQRARDALCICMGV